jgi:hypothetical protein
VTLTYWEIDPGKLDEARKFYKGQGDQIVQDPKTKKYHVMTTKEGEMSYLLQAVLDNTKYHLVEEIAKNFPTSMDFGLSQFFYSRIFRGSGAFPDLSPKRYSGAQRKAIQSVYVSLNHGRDRQTQDESGRQATMAHNINVSLSMYKDYFGEGSRVEPTIENYRKISSDRLSEINERLLSRVESETISELTTNGNITPTEYMLLHLGWKHLVEAEDLDDLMGISLNNDPLKPSDAHFQNAHITTMNNLDFHFEEILSKIPVEDNIHGKQLAGLLRDDIESIMEERKQKIGSQSIENALSTVQYEYLGLDQEFRELLDEWYDQLNGEDKEKFKVPTTIWFLYGLSHSKRRRARVIKLPPLYLVDKDILIAYGKEYIKHIYKPVTVAMRSDEARYPNLTNMLTSWKEKDNYCG